MDEHCKCPECGSQPASVERRKEKLIFLCYSKGCPLYRKEFSVNDEGSGNLARRMRQIAEFYPLPPGARKEFSEGRVIIMFDFA